MVIVRDNERRMAICIDRFPSIGNRGVWCSGFQSEVDVKAGITARRLDSAAQAAPRDVFNCSR